jgi:hypothetical protein
MALYPYNKTLSTISSFSIFASFNNATPRFVVYLDKNDDGVAESILLSDYQMASNGAWQISTGGNRWGWTEANYQLSSYGVTWKSFDSWRNDYGNARVLFLGIALEYWSVDPYGFGEPLYADELILNSVTYNIAPSETPVPTPAPTPLPSPTSSSNSFNVQLQRSYDGQASFTGEKVHTDPKSVRLVIPQNASQGSYAMALYPYDGTLSSITSFAIFTSYIHAVPRFMLCLDKNNHGWADTFLLSDYQSTSNGEWKATTGGNRWGWTETNIQLTDYGSTWNSIDSWMTKYGSLKVLFIGIVLEYWAVDPDGFGEPLYADELIVNGVTYKITTATSTSSPSPSPSPTSSSSPSASPTPSATAGSPRISISVNASSSVVGSVVNVNGRLSYVNGSPLRGEPVILSYAVAGSSPWVPIGSAVTNDAGEYNIQWVNVASGTFSLKVEWAEHEGHEETSNTTTLSFLPYENQSVFFVESNSTVSALAFNSTSSDLSFTVSGPSDTEGYVKVTIAKSLVSSAENIKVYLDGDQLNYAVVSDGDLWQLTFSYLHSSHQVRISLAATAAGVILLGIEYWIWTAIAIIIALTGVSAFIVWRIKKKQKA